MRPSTKFNFHPYPPIRNQSNTQGHTKNGGENSLPQGKTLLTYLNVPDMVLTFLKYLQTHIHTNKYPISQWSLSMYFNKIFLDFKCPQNTNADGKVMIQKIFYQIILSHMYQMLPVINDIQIVTKLKTKSTIMKLYEIRMCRLKKN